MLVEINTDKSHQDAADERQIQNSAIIYFL
jgi:hypothetical protein